MKGDMMNKKSLKNLYTIQLSLMYVILVYSIIIQLVYNQLERVDFTIPAIWLVISLLSLIIWYIQVKYNRDSVRIKLIKYVVPFVFGIYCSFMDWYDGRLLTMLVIQTILFLVVAFSQVVLLTMELKWYQDEKVTKKDFILQIICLLGLTLIFLGISYIDYSAQLSGQLSCANCVYPEFIHLRNMGLYFISLGSIGAIMYPIQWMIHVKKPLKVFILLNLLIFLTAIITYMNAIWFLNETFVMYPKSLYVDHIRYLSNSNSVEQLNYSNIILSLGIIINLMIGIVLFVRKKKFN